MLYVLQIGVRMVSWFVSCSQGKLQGQVQKQGVYGRPTQRPRRHGSRFLCQVFQAYVRTPTQYLPSCKGPRLGMSPGLRIEEV